MRKIVGAIEPTKDMKPNIALFSLDTGKRRSQNAQTRDTNGKRNRRKGTKSSNELRPTFATPEPATRNPIVAPYAPPTNPRSTDIFSDRPNTRH
jgi:hypothetical protein